MHNGFHDNAALVVAIALAAGVVAQSIARHLRIPGIVLLLAVGVALGPDLAGIVVPATLGPALEVLIGFAVAVILFDGGLNLNLRRMRGQAPVIQRLLSIGVVVTTARRRPGGPPAPGLGLDPVAAVRHPGHRHRTDRGHAPAAADPRAPQRRDHPRDRGRADRRRGRGGGGGRPGDRPGQFADRRRHQRADAPAGGAAGGRGRRRVDGRCCCAGRWRCPRATRPSSPWP